jgi:hypothetical protein
MFVDDYPMIVGEKMGRVRYLDWVIDEENFVENNLIEIEDLMARHDRQFVESEIINRVELFKKRKLILLKKHQVMGNFVDVVMIV